jgi:hypothetical protein
MSEHEFLGHGGQVMMRKNLTVILTVRDESSMGPFSESEAKDLADSFKVLGTMKQEEGVFTFDMGKYARATDHKRITEVLEAYSVRHQRRMVFTMRSSDGELDVAKILLENKEVDSVSMMDPRPPELKPASETVESTGFIDGVWIAGRNKAVAVYLIVPESQDVSLNSEELMDANFMDFKRIDSHQLFLTYRRLQETAFNDIKQRVELFNRGTGNVVVADVKVLTAEEIDSINEKIAQREAMLERDPLPKVNTSVPMPPVKPPKLELVTRAAVHPDMFNLDVSVMQRVTTKVLDVTIGADRPWGSEYLATAIEMEAWRLVAQTFRSIRQHRSATRVHNSFTGTGIIMLDDCCDDPHKMLETLDKINKEFPCNMQVKLYDPNLIPVKPIEPGVRIMKNHKDISNYRVMARVTVNGLEKSEREFFQLLCAAMNGTVVSANDFEIDLGEAPDEYTLRAIVAGLIRVSDLQTGNATYDYRFYKKHVSDGTVIKDAVTFDEGKKVVQATIHGEMTTDIVQKFSKAFPVTGSWLNSNTFQVECGEHETPFEVAVALNTMVNEVNNERPKGFISRFLSNRNPLRPPPRPGSAEQKRQSAVWGAVNQNFNNNLDGAIYELERQIEERPLENIPKDELANDPAIKALGALRYTKAAARKRVIKTRLWRFFIVALLIAIGGAIYQYNEYLFDRGYATSVLDCSVPYGSDRLTGKRYVTSEYRSLFGVRLSFDSNIKDVTKLDLPNDNIILLGINPKNNKPWRMNFGKGEQGAQPLQPTEQYWFVGNKDAATVSYSNFCTKG